MYLNAFLRPAAFPIIQHPLVNIATDKNETFAVIVVKKGGPHYSQMSSEEIMLIFTEEDGFVQALDYEHSLEGQEGVFNRPFLCSSLVSI